MKKDSARTDDEETRQRQAEISALSEASRAVLDYRDFESAARSIFDACKRSTGATAGYVALLNEDGTENKVVFLDSGGAACAVDPALPMPIRGLREEAYRTGKAVYENDFSHSQWTRFLPQGHASLDSVLFAPLLIKGIVVGLLGLANKPGGFTETDARMASTFGELAAIALLNSRALESLRSSEERFRAVAQTAGDAIITIDSRGNIVFWNEAATTIFGYAPDEAIGKPLTFIMPERFHADHQNGVERVVSTGKSRILGETVEMVGLGRDGREFPIELSLSTWKSRDQIFFTGIIRDITERMQAEELLRDQTQFITTVFESLAHPFYVVDANDYTIKMANSAAYLGTLSETVTCHALTHGRRTPCGDDAHLCPLEEIKKTGEPAVTEHVHYDREGHRRVYEVRGHPIFGSEGKVAQIIEYTLDITERKRAEEALRERTHELGERVQELNCLYGISALVERPGISLAEILQETVDLIPLAWQYPEITAARVVLEGHEFKTANYGETTPWQQVADIRVRGQQSGTVEVCYLEERPQGDEGPFLREERSLLSAIAERLGGITERVRAEEALHKAHDELELRVRQRTAELAQANLDLHAEIAQHNQTAETLRESEERYRRLVEVAFEAIAIRCEGKIVYINPAGAKLLGADNPDELIGRPFRDFVHPDYWEIVQTRAQGAQEDGLSLPRMEEKLIRLDGNILEVEVAGIPVTYEGRPAVQIVIHDLTARKRAERERQKERERIARDLHDSLGHSLGFLHLKLDQLAYGEGLGDAERLRQDMAQMRDVANQAYEIVRGMLATLHPSNVASLADALLALARAAGQRAHFTVQFSSEGLPSALHPIVQQQTVYIFQEALNNITKHANAECVDINLCWTEEALTAVISDNGCGFDVADQHSDGHYGLRIMQERAEEINGQLVLTSGPGCGTQITLRLPLQRP
jgi:PAS domain S-box-containing protein